MLYCKNCEKYMTTQDKDTGICSLPHSWQLVKAESPCRYLFAKKRYCKDCCHFGNDSACSWALEYDEACSSEFESNASAEIGNILRDMYLHGENVDEVIKNLVETFNHSELRRFIDKHKEDVVFEDDGPLDIQQIKERIYPVCESYGIEHMFLFGSRARGEAWSESDVDFYLDKPGKIKSLLQISGLRLDLEDCLGKEVDLVTAIDENSIFWKEASKDFVTVYGESEGDAGVTTEDNTQTVQTKKDIQKENEIAGVTEGLPMGCLQTNIDGFLEALKNIK